MIDWMESFFEVYENRPKFSFIFHSEYTQQLLHILPVVDTTLVLVSIDIVMLILIMTYSRLRINYNSMVHGIYLLV